LRKNPPITTVEYPISDDTLIASRTDAGGRRVSTISSSSPRDSLKPNWWANRTASSVIRTCRRSWTRLWGDPQPEASRSIGIPDGTLGQRVAW